MAGKQPGMITGANAKIQVGDAILAYASDITYNLTIDHIPVEVMNKYEVVSNEPVSMSLSGSFSVVRYSKMTSEPVPVKDSKGNPIADTAAFTPASTNSPNAWGIGKAFSPGELLASKTFDITIYQRYVDDKGNEQVIKFLKFKDCRITSRSTSLNKRSVASERFDFVGITMDDDINESGTSGDADLST